MINYTPSPIPTDTSSIPAYLVSEFNKIALAMQHGPNNMEKTYVAPDKPRDGDLKYADGTHWNPGSGVGIYYYKGSASAWIFLG
jgi:hypothetical protein